jgi:hypothetical protein
VPSALEVLVEEETARPELVRLRSSFDPITGLCEGSPTRWSISWFLLLVFWQLLDFFTVEKAPRFLHRGEDCCWPPKTYFCLQKWVCALDRSPIVCPLTRPSSTKRECHLLPSQQLLLFRKQSRRRNKLNRGEATPSEWAASLVGMDKYGHKKRRVNRRPCKRSHTPSDTDTEAKEWKLLWLSKFLAKKKHLISFSILFIFKVQFKNTASKFCALYARLFKLIEFTIQKIYCRFFPWLVKKVDTFFLFSTLSAKIMFFLQKCQKRSFSMTKSHHSAQEMMENERKQHVS